MKLSVKEHKIVNWSQLKISFCLRVTKGLDTDYYQYLDMDRLRKAKSEFLRKVYLVKEI